MELLRFDFSKLVFYSLVTLVISGAIFLTGMHSGLYKTSSYRFIRNLKIQVLNVIEEAPILTKSHPGYFLKFAKHKGNGVTINELKNNDDYILISSFYDDNNEIRLIKRNGEIISRWPLRFYEIFNKDELTGEIPTTDWNVDTHGTLILPDGSIVFNFEYNGLVKLNKCGEVIWKNASNTHHSVEVSEDGGFWVPGQFTLPPGSEITYAPYQLPVKVDTILKISPEGEILKEISIPDLFLRNNLFTLLTATGRKFGPTSIGHDKWGAEITTEMTHVNKIAELPSKLANKFPLFNAGDLVISMRNRNMIVVFNPEQLKIKWWKIGPWIRQHDPEFNKNGKISIFNNNLYQQEFELGIPGNSNIIEIDPVTNQHEIIYGDKKGQVMRSRIRGKHEILENGGLLVTEFEGGRIFETDKNGKIVWEYINRFDSDEVAEITEARSYPINYFKVKDWSCTN